LPVAWLVLYGIVPTLQHAHFDAWPERFCRFWDPPLEALATEIARGKRARKRRR
jgi:hypothetical protein